MMSESIAESFEVSPQQEQLWLAEPDGPSARLQVVLSLSAAIEPTRVEDALAATVARHEILRTTFVRRPGIRVPLQVIAGELAPAWRVEHGADVAEVCRNELSEPWDLSVGPLVHGALLTGTGERQVLVLTVSSLCLDASSLAPLARELAHRLGADEPLAEDPLQYADFAAWQRELITTDDDAARAAREFWARLEGAAPLALPFDRAARGPFTPDEVAVELDAPTAAALAEQAGRYGVGESTLVQAAWHALLARASGEQDVVVGDLGTDRNPELEGAIGAFVRPVPLRTQIDPGLTFAELLQSLDRARQDAAQWQDYAPPQAQELLAVGFISTDAYRGAELAIERVVSPGPPFRLWLTRDDGLRLSFDPATIAPDAVGRLGGQLARLLAAVAADPAIAIDAIEILGESERAQLAAFNDTARAVPAECVHELIAAHAATAPEREAVVDDGGAISFGELDRRANQLAQRLRRSGVGPDTVVGLCTDRSIEMVVGLLGILKAGGAYLPLNFEHPPARLAQQLTSAQAVAIVAQEAVLDRLPEFAGEVVCLDRDRDALDGEPAEPPAVTVAHRHLVYVMYTSGSTGAPKGVAVTHGNLVNYATAIAGRIGADREPLRFATVTAISTDLGNTAVFGALCSGGTLVLVSPAAAADGAALAGAFERSPVDVLKVTPSHLQALLASRDTRVLPRRWLVLGGERATWDLVAAVREQSDCGILNHYGPTETTVGSTTLVVGDGPGPFAPATVPIGGPLANTRTHVLDGHRRPVPVGVPGWLHIAGAGVARGYIGSGELTAERFVADPDEPGALMYDTGDLARWLPDGTLEFLGRTDDQLKIRGYRVEPAEVEAALRAHPAVSDAIVVPWTSGAGDVRLVAYVAAAAGAAEDELRTHLGDRVPDFMLPSIITVLPALPRTPSGKVDRQALPDPSEAEHAGADYVVPASPMEETLAEIWAHVLGVDRVGRDDDFFALGGHSLLATQVVAQVRSDFAIDLPLHSLFSYSTVATLTAEIVQMMGDSEEEETARLVAELEGLSDEEAERLLAGESTPPDS